MRLVVLIPLLAAILNADPVTVVETRSAFGMTSLSYFYNLPTSTGGVNAHVDASANCFNVVPACPANDPATAIIELTLDFYTAGLARDGIAYLSLNFDSDGDVGGTARESGAIGPYSYSYAPSFPFCPKGISCNLSGYFPLELGVPFKIDLYILTYGFAPQGGAGATANASLQLYEVPPQGGGAVGAPVQILLVPEPSASALAGIGFCAMIIFATRVRKLFTLRACVAVAAPPEMSNMLTAKEKCERLDQRRRP